VRYTIRGLLLVVSPLSLPAEENRLSVSGHEQGVGRVSIPASTLAAALRAQADISLRESLWGTSHRRAALSVSAGTLQVEEEAHAMDHVVRVSAGETKDRYPRVDYVVPSGARFRLQITLDDPQPGDLAELLAVLESGLFLGRRTRFGYGAVRAEAIQVTPER
jgi:CRISPR/Cas system CSM-associated protein Csm3 (group 7 of RAMP superfamily)